MDMREQGYDYSRKENGGTPPFSSIWDSMSNSKH